MAVSFKTIAATAVLASMLSMSLTACQSVDSNAKTHANGCNGKSSCKAKASCKAKKKTSTEK